MDRKDDLNDEWGERMMHDRGISDSEVGVGVGGEVKRELGRGKNLFRASGML